MSRANQYFLSGEGIAREVIAADIQRYLGADALVRPGVGSGDYENTKGYWIMAHRPLTTQMILDLKGDSQRWNAELGNDRISSYRDSQTHAGRQYYGPTEGLGTAEYVNPASYDPNPGYQETPQSFQQYPTRPLYYTASDGRVYPYTSYSQQSPPYAAYPQQARQYASYSQQTRPYASYSQPSPSQARSQHSVDSWHTARESRIGYYLASDGRQYPLTQMPSSRHTTEHVRQSRDDAQGRISPRLSVEENEKINLQVTVSFQSLQQTTEILNESLDMVRQKCGWEGDASGTEHSGPALTRTDRGSLGRGAIGEVDEVRTPTGIETLARKRIAISRRRDVASRDVKLIQDEIKNLKDLLHPHVVKIIGSYQENPGTWKHSYCLLMHPVGDNDLSGFLEDDCRCIRDDPDEEKSIIYSTWIMKWFGCLATALAYMHSQRIHHEDIKPKNIIHKGEHVYFTDFSSSRKIETGEGTSTANPARASRLFAAPEALPTEDGSIGRHGSRTDVFSLGLVFVEMLTILEGHDIDGLHEYLEKNNGFGTSWESRQYHRAVELMKNWFTAGQGRDMYEKCIQPMLKEDRKARPSAAQVVQNIRSHQPWKRTLACPCKDVLTEIPSRPKETAVTAHIDRDRSEQSNRNSETPIKSGDEAGGQQTKRDNVVASGLEMVMPTSKASISGSSQPAENQRAMEAASSPKVEKLKQKNAEHGVDTTVDPTKKVLRRSLARASEIESPPPLRKHTSMPTPKEKPNVFERLFNSTTRRATPPPSTDSDAARPPTPRVPAKRQSTFVNLFPKRKSTQ